VEVGPTSDSSGDTPEPLSDAPFAVGERLPDGQVVREVRRGGQAWVLVVGGAAGRRAVKVPRSGAIAGDAEIAQMLRLSPHPRVVTALDVIELGGRRGIVMEYVPDTLATSIRRSDSFLPAIQQVCDGMEYLSANGEFAHLDLKPSNLLIDDRGDLKIGDFGLSRPARSRAGQFTAAGGGTWAYAAPEVIRGEHCDSRADIFSVGVIVYQCATGRLPYPFELAATPGEQREQLLAYYDSPGPKRRTEEIYYSGGSSEVPVALPTDELAILVQGCLQADMSQRQSSFYELSSQISYSFGVPRRRAETERLPTLDQQFRELALARTLTRMGAAAEAVRRCNRLLSASLPDQLATSVLDATREALIAAGRGDELGVLEGWP
jgi:serine/threonine protein kinase